MNDLDISGGVLKASPVLTVSSMTYCGFTLADWVYISTIFYVVVQSVCLIYKTFHNKKRG